MSEFEAQSLKLEAYEKSFQQILQVLLLRKHSPSYLCEVNEEDIM